MNPSKRKTQPPEKFDPKPEGSQMISERVQNHRRKKDERERKRKEKDADLENNPKGMKKKKVCKN